MAGVPLNDLEWHRIESVFSLLKSTDRNQCLKTDEPTRMYNGIAWSIGVTNLWIDPPQPQAVLEEFYKERGFQSTSLQEATIDVFSHPSGRMAHASRRDGNVWSSKLGVDMRITHPRYKLQGDNYGYIVVSFKRIPGQASAPALLPPTSSSISRSDAGARVAVSKKLTSLIERSTESFPTLADNFDKNWRAWADTWDIPQATDMQSSEDFAQGSAWDALIGMGPTILPQVVGKLQSDTNIFGCQLYNYLQGNPSKRVSPGNLMEYYVLNSQAASIVKLYGSHALSFESIATNWTAAQSVGARSSDSSSYTSGPAYEALRAMGKPAVPFIMDMYAREPDGWWHELLYEIEYGRKSGAQVFDKAALYKYWSDWFQGIITTTQRSLL